MLPFLVPLAAYLTPLATPVVVSTAAVVVSTASAVAVHWSSSSTRAKLFEAEQEIESLTRSIDETRKKATNADGNAQIALDRLEDLQRLAAEAGRRAEEARLYIERKWFEGVRPECRPSEEDITRMKSQYHYSPGFIHIAVVGSAGAGKSSFINAVRGLSKNDPGAAPTGIVETTATVTRYADPHKDSCMVWYDVPGSGTPNVPDWQYFNDKGLYIFDCIIVLTDNRVLESDLAILRACEQFKNIDAFILRSKSDQHINNMACEKMPQGFDPCDPDMDAETRSHFLLTKLEERQRFIEETSQNVEMHLERGKLLPKKVYVICMDAMVATMRQIRSSKAIDEADLLSDVRGCVLRRLQSGW
ncbi:interferon-inducible GTPase-domain-containing protein [Suillus occidentalis]|nr:interferon-inducible GTPase-domain-containing protein [Suillus occidentalis]